MVGRSKHKMALYTKEVCVHGSGVLFSQVTLTSEVWQPEIGQLAFPYSFALHDNQ